MHGMRYERTVRREARHAGWINPFRRFTTFYQAWASFSVT